MFAEAKTETGQHSSPTERLPMTELVARHGYLRDLTDKMIGEQEALAAALQQVMAEEGADLMVGGSGADEKSAAIDELEHEIRIIGYQMELIEDVIFETPPRDVAEALSKLRFLSLQMQDGYEFSPDYFASVMEECSDLIEEEAESEPEVATQH